MPLALVVLGPSALELIDNDAGTLAEVLGVRREAVTQAAGRLQKARLIHLSRGQIAVLDRSRLEARVCECYAVVRREHDRLLAYYRRVEEVARDREIARVRRLPRSSDARRQPSIYIATGDYAPAP